MLRHANQAEPIIGSASSSSAWARDQKPPHAGDQSPTKSAATQARPVQRLQIVDATAYAADSEATRNAAFIQPIARAMSPPGTRAASP